MGTYYRIVRISLYFSHYRDFVGDCFAVDSLHRQTVWSFVRSQSRDNGIPRKFRTMRRNTSSFRARDGDRFRLIHPPVTRVSRIGKVLVPFRGFVR